MSGQMRMNKLFENDTTEDILATIADPHPDYCGLATGKGFCTCGEDEAEEYLWEMKYGHQQ